MNKTARVLEETGTVYLSRAHWLTPGLPGGVRVPNRFSYLCVSVLLLVSVACVLCLYLWILHSLLHFGLL